MTVSVILRLVAGTLTNGRVAGHAEVVDTGETLIFSDQEEMLAFLHRAATQHAQDIGGTDERAADSDGS